MDSFETERRRLIDGLTREIVALAAEVAREAIATARAEQRDAERAERKAPRVSARLQRALERAEERRRLAAERRAASALRPSSRRQKAAPSAPGHLTKEEQAPAQSAPKPLFVHKRSRDGSIQQLERAAAEAASPPA
jgi:hypothetical protein